MTLCCHSEVCEWQIVKGCELSRIKEGLRGAEEEPALLARRADDQACVLQRIENMAPIRALQFNEPASGDRLQVRDQGQDIMSGVGEEARLLVIGEDGLLRSRRDREVIPSLLLRNAKPPLGILLGESAESRDDRHLAVLEELDEFGDGKRLRC
jgi:hypothetical protein